MSGPITSNFISNNEPSFIENLKNNRPIWVNDKGDSGVEGKIKFFLRTIFLQKDKPLVETTRLFTKRLKQIEANNPVIFKSNAIENQDLYKSHQVIGAILLEKLKNKTSHAAKEAFSELEKHYYSFLYRYELEKTAPLTEIEIQAFENQLKDKVIKWKNTILSLKNPFPQKKANNTLTEEERALLRPLFKYKHFINHLLKHPEELEKTFEWILLQKNPVDAYVEFHKTSLEIAHCGLANHVGYINTGTDNQIFRVFKEAQTKKIQLKIEGNNWIDARKKNDPLHFYRQGTKTILHSTTLQKIYEDFGKQPMHWTDFCVTPDGIIFWSAHKLGKKVGNGYESINLEKKDWWKQLPAQNWISLEDAQKKFGSSINENNWGLDIVTTRTSEDMVPEGNHVRIDFISPSDRNGKKGFEIRSLGLSSEFLPTTFFQKLLFIVRIYKAIIMSPDTSISFLKRQEKHYFSIIPEKEIEKVITLFKEKIEEGRNGKLVYQVLTMNCADLGNEFLKFSWHKYHKVDLFKTEILKEGARVGAFGVVSKIVDLLSFFFNPFSIWNKIFWALGGTKKFTIRAPDGRILSSLSFLDLFSERNFLISVPAKAFQYI